MLSIGKLGVAGGAEYYLDKMANSVDDYYLGRGEAPGQWVGQTAAALGLVGQGDPGDLRNVPAGRAADGETVGLQVQRVADRVTTSPSQRRRACRCSGRSGRPTFVAPSRLATT